jgi:hypothetical protein
LGIMTIFLIGQSWFPVQLGIMIIFLIGQSWFPVQLGIITIFLIFSGFCVCWNWNHEHRILSWFWIVRIAVDSWWSSTASAALVKTLTTLNPGFKIRYCNSFSFIMILRLSSLWSVRLVLSQLVSGVT